MGGELKICLKIVSKSYGDCNRAIFIKNSYAAVGEFSPKIIILIYCKRTSKKALKNFSSLFVFTNFQTKI